MRVICLAAALLASMAPRAAAEAAEVVFEVDARVERLSVVLMLAEPADFKARRPGGLDAYAAAADAAFKSFSSHPAVAKVASLRRGGATTAALARVVLAPKSDDPLIDALRDFDTAARFADFFASQAKAHAAFAAAARKESLRAISPEAALAYMGLPFTGRHRFILAPLLPEDEGLSELRVRPGVASPEGLRFRFGSFDGSVAAALCREAVDWLRAPDGGIPAHVAAAVGLRVLARDLGEDIYAAALGRNASARLPHLQAMSERLKDYEDARDRHPTLRSFFPRFEAVAAIRVEQAALAAREGRREAALAFLAEARLHNPDLAARRRMMHLYHDLKDEAAAKGLSAELATGAAEQPGVSYDRAALAARAGDREAALKLLDGGRESSPDVDARRRMAALYIELKEYVSARELLDALLAASPQDGQLTLNRALVATRTGDREAALRLLDAAKSRRPGAEDRRLMAQLYQELGETRPASLLLDGLIGENPVDTRLILDRAAVSAEAGEREQALRLLAEARRQPPDRDARLRMAALYERLEAAPEALALLEENLEQSPADAPARLELAKLAARAGAREKALQHLAAARGLAASHDERRLLAGLYRELNEPAQAKDLLAGLVLAAPHDAGLRLDQAALAAQTGDRDAALGLLAEAKQLASESGDRHRLALLHQALNDYAPAAILLRTLVREQPGNAALRGDLGLCLHLDGRTEEAARELRAAIKLDPAALPAVITLGTIYAAQKRYDLELAVYDAVPAAGGAPALRAVLIQNQRAARARVP